MKFTIRPLLAAIFALVLLPQAFAQTYMQFSSAPWGGFAPARIQCGWLYGANMNTTADQAIPIAVPSYTWAVDSIVVSNPSVSLTTAAGGVYTAASKGGIAIVASGQAYSGLTTNAVNTAGSLLALTIATAGNTTAFQGFGTGDISQVFLSLTTAQGAAATADVRVFCKPLF